MPAYTLYSHLGPGPNPLKAAVLMEHLGLDYEVVPLVFGDDPEKGVKGAKFLKINPNGRVLALSPMTAMASACGSPVRSCSTSLTSTTRKVDSTERPEERGIVNQWLTHQLSGLGPTQVR